MNTQTKVETLRSIMHKHNVDIYIVPSTDCHNNEYVPSCYERRAWISGFTGSAGEVVIAPNHGYLWTDGRYFLQATNQLDPNLFSLMKQTGFVPEIEVWIKQNGKDKVVAVDPKLISITRAQKLEEAVNQAGGKMVFLETNLVDLTQEQFNQNQALPQSPVFELKQQYSGISLKDKLSQLREQLTKHQANYIVLNALDEIAWLLNLRGSDVEYNPLFLSYAIVGEKDIRLFVDQTKFTQELKATLSNEGVVLCDYADFSFALTKLNGVVWLDDKIANYSILTNACKSAEVVFARSPIIAEKACKNEVETSGARFAHIKDAAAVIGFLHWIENNWQRGIDEISSADKLSEFRHKQANLRGESFATISGFANNGAVIHYRASSETNKVIDDSNLYLIDSGAQYLEGTTDITRTIHLGQPTKEQKRHYTLVLKGHLALANAVFPKGTCGEHLDALARMYLWNDYLNYRHGTGHGVGSFLCVHEGPQKISSAISNVPLLPGMIVSNEPGFYLDGHYGIRIENLCLVTQKTDNQALNSSYGSFYAFDNLTLVPYCKRLIDFELLSNQEIEQIKQYYAQIKQLVSPHLDGTQQSWLANEINIS